MGKKTSQIILTSNPAQWTVDGGHKNNATLVALPYA